MARREGGELTRAERTDLAERDQLSDAERILRIRESMNESRRQVAENLERLRHEVRDAADWRGWVRREPWTSIGIALGIGFFVGFR